MASKTDYAVPTGEFIAEWLEDRDMSRAELARRAGVSRKHITMVIAGAPVTPDFATKLALVTHVPAERWLALEAQYRADVERLGLENSLSADKCLLERFKASLTYLRARGVIAGDVRKPGHLMVQLMSFFDVGAPEALVPANLLPQVAFHQTQAFDAEMASLATWLRLAKLAAVEEPLAHKYQASLLQEALPEIRAMSMRLVAEPMAFVECLAQAGVQVVVQPEIKGCRAYGATFWLADQPVIVLSARGKKDGPLWFTLFHELGHVLRHPLALCVEGEPGTNPDEDREAEANEFAEEWLIPASIRDELIGIQSKSGVADLARRAGVSSGVILHHLHHHGMWPYRHGQDLYLKLTVSDE
ncbi:ImmA/IrrE family metallo-endopeptidase [Tessaracoccus sp. MC1679]|uniref:XRE family transcriptional regulator n=1 Tax=Tessaracoccus sp. MC1679 TaxID=2760313 RepID=UPI0016008904|nr:ImmA/IrrE family metallo-endopeptidase [Tessaracoccus sp. MC1679]MBB1515004.1 ImmA/IrrE family metallo-endopeptidase [Tessaracoccus sp. MC1679]